MSPLLALVLAARAAEPCRATYAELLPALDAVEASWGMNERSFTGAVAALDARLPCLTEVLSPAAAAKVHRAEGLAAFFAQDIERARAAFLAARVADPAYAFPEAMVPPEHALRLLYDASAPAGAPIRLEAPARGHLVLDGVSTRTRAGGLPTVFQHAEPGGVTRTAWLAPGVAPPAYRVRGQGLRLPLLVGAGAAAAGAGVLYALALDIRTDPPAFDSEAELTAIADRNHAYVGGAAGLGALAVAGGAGALVWGRW